MVKATVRTTRSAAGPKPVIDVQATVTQQPSLESVLPATAAPAPATAAPAPSADSTIADPAIVAAIVAAQAAEAAPTPPLAATPPIVYHKCAIPGCETKMSAGSPAICPTHQAMFKQLQAAPNVQQAASNIQQAAKPAPLPAAAPAPANLAEPSIDAALAEAAPVEQTLAVATRAASGVSHAPALHADGLEGEWTRDDLKFPQIKIVQGSGPLSKDFDLGTIILGEMELLPPPSLKEGAVNASIRFAPMSLQKQFREKLTQEQIAEEIMPRIANTVSEVEELGGTTVWVGQTMPDNYWEPSARCLFLIEQPEGSEHPAFNQELDGKLYALAVYYAAGGAFRDSAKVIINTALTSLLTPVIDPATGLPVKTASGQIAKKSMLWKNFWTLNFAKKAVGQFNPWRPILKLTKTETGPQLREYCRENVVQMAASSHAAAE